MLVNSKLKLKNTALEVAVVNILPFKFDNRLTTKTA